ncbi:DUF1254 domain-containing protein [Xanthomarina sp. F1114]|uniref:DUF1254 domain-containing protein n=1 Tax=Xanthomarina sp. F1114 TaxID=2996019 RepID=UPI00225DFBCF|nr:DUF1254 domain-containing protein [Xanthomarina sp. F1114]MCX7548801.1 DUF1254 domain-containing protein [Xanthomarina sp. F1114]
MTLSCNEKKDKKEAVATTELSLDSITAITKKAYIYGYPIVDNYRIQYDYFEDSTNSEFKAPWNHVANIARVYTPKDVAVQTPNSDTPYSFVGFDLRAEPIVLTVPDIEANRYFMIQFIDAYTFNFDYVGSRTTGNKGAKFMVAGPNWKGETPEGIDKVITSETQFVMAFYRTQLFNPGDIDNIKKIQAQFKAEPLSSYLGTEPVKVEKIDFFKPIPQAEQKTSLEFFKEMNFALQFMPPNNTETELMSRFAKIGVGAGKDFDVQKLSPEVKAAMEKGIQEAWTVDFAALKKKFETGEVTSGDIFGTREFLKNNYLYRMSGAVIGIFGNSKEEAMYPFYGVDSDGNPLDGTTNKYTLHFVEGELPPVNAFWSLTMYKMPQSLLVDNPINRYLLNSTMIPDFVRDKDGGITLYLQSESPGKAKEANWLPAPKGPFVTIMRLYWPKEAALDGSWKNPPLELVK